MVSKQMFSAPLLVLTSACVVSGPIIDRSFEKAPFSACADMSAAAGVRVGQQPVRIGCFDALARTLSAGQQIPAGDHLQTSAGLRVTGAAAFRLAGGEGCTGRFTNIVMEYTAPAGAAATVTATDALGRHLGMRRLEAEASPKLRQLVVRDMADPLKDPSVAEISDVQGELFVRSLCLKGY